VDPGPEVSWFAIYDAQAKAFVGSGNGDAKSVADAVDLERSKDPWATIVVGVETPSVRGPIYPAVLDAAMAAGAVMALVDALGHAVVYRATFSEHASLLTGRARNRTPDIRAALVERVGPRRFKANGRGRSVPGPLAPIVGQHLLDAASVALYALHAHFERLQESPRRQRPKRRTI
jgi:hypothetical protein